MKGVWHVYMVECADGTLYTGITTDISRRLKEHNGSSRAARYTRHRRPVSLVYSEQCDSRSHASTREYELKKLTREEKDALVRRFP